MAFFSQYNDELFPLFYILVPVISFAISTNHFYYTLEYIVFGHILSLDVKKKGCMAVYITEYYV